MTREPENTEGNTPQTPLAEDHALARTLEFKGADRIAELTTLSYSLANSNTEPSKALSILHSINKGHCTPPLDDDTVSSIFEGVRMRLQREEQPDEIRDIQLHNLSADLIGRRVRTRVQVVGKKDHKALPAGVDASCSHCGEVRTIPLTRQPRLLMSYIKDKRSVKARQFIDDENEDICCDHEARELKARFSEQMVDYTILYVRPLQTETDCFSAHQSSVREAHLIGAKAPDANQIEIVGSAVYSSKDNDIAIVAVSANSLQDDFLDFNLNERDKDSFREHFMERDDAHLQIAPNIVGKGREAAKLWAALTHHSVYRIPDINGNIIRGCLHGVFFGDSTQGKSDIGGEGTDHPNSSIKPTFGEAIVMETSSRTGVLYSIDPDKGILQWGALPNNDRRYVLIDGGQKMSSEEMGEYREALRGQRVKVDRSQKGEAPARVRQIFSYNPNKESLQDYLYPCQAILDSRPFRDPVDSTRFDYFVPFCQSDVAYEEIATSKGLTKPMPDEVYVRHVLWAWSREPDNVVYGERTGDAIKQAAIALEKNYRTRSLPLVNNSIRDIITRVSVAFACLRHSTDEDNVSVIVTENHVQLAYGLIEETFNLLKLREFKLQEDGKFELLRSDLMEAFGVLRSEHIEVLEHIGTKTLTSGEIADRMGCSMTSIKRYFNDLSDVGFIETGHYGAAVTGKGLKFVHLLLGLNGVTVSKCDTVSTDYAQSVSVFDTVTPRIGEERRLSCLQGASSSQPLITGNTGHDAGRMFSLVDFSSGVTQPLSPQQTTDKGDLGVQEGEAEPADEDQSE